MKFIHCADLHLDSKMTANLDPARAKQRRGELLHTFERMVDYAAQNGVTAVLIAGDLFDTEHVSATASNAVLSAIESHPQLTFYYLRGNHDRERCLSGTDGPPQNLKLFGSEWTTYEENGVFITGVELGWDNAASSYLSLRLDPGKFNIVMLHGQDAQSAGKEQAEIIRLKELQNRGIDYLALGHVHARKTGALDSRGSYCYPGCLEGRGFDECGEHGFEVIDVADDLRSFEHRFVPFSSRKLYTVAADVTGCVSSREMKERADRAVTEAGCKPNDLLKLVLTGGLDVACEKDLSYILSYFSQQFYFVKLSDETTLKVEIADYLLDRSLKGEYVRTVCQDPSLPEEEKAAVIRYGLQALAGEEVQ